jgi:hypothetical protein
MMMMLYFYLYDSRKTEGKNEFVPTHAVKAYGETGNLAPFILNLGNGWLLSSQIYAPDALLAARNPVPTD